VKGPPPLPGRSRASAAAGKQEAQLVDAEVELDVGFDQAKFFFVRLSGPAADDKPAAQPDVCCPAQS